MYCNCVTNLYICVTFLVFLHAMATISIRVDDTLKKETQYLSDELGISLSSLITMWMKKFVREKKLEIVLDDTHRAWYEGKDMVEVNAPAKEVRDYLHLLQK